MIGLTHKQRELLDFIGERMAVDGVCPSYQEMNDAMGLHSKAGISRLLTGLEERGIIRRLPNRARAIEILETPRPILSAPKARPLLREDTDALIHEMQCRGFHVERAAA